MLNKLDRQHLTLNILKTSLHINFIVFFGLTLAKGVAYIYLKEEKIYS